MAVPPDQALARNFTATAAAPSTQQMMKYTYVCMFVGVASLGAIYMALFMIGAILDSHRVWQIGGPVVFFAFLLLAMPLYGVVQRRLNRDKTVFVSVGSAGLTVTTRPGEVFSLGDVQLGRWTPAGYGGMTKGTALHLSSGRRRYVLGGRDHRAAAGIPMRAVPVDVVDAWLWAADFDELLTAVGNPGQVDADAAVPGQLTRCLLIPNPMRMISSSFFGMFKNTATALTLSARPPQPAVAIDVAEEAISVIDLKRDTLIASAPVAQVTATPAQSSRSMPRMGTMTTPVLVLRVADSQPLTIGCQDFAGPPQATLGGRTTLIYRFSWRGLMPSEPEPAFVVSDADWLTLVERFGLADRLEDRAKAGAAAVGTPLARPNRKLWIYAGIFAAIMFVAAPAMMFVASSISTNHQLKDDRLTADREKPFALPFTDLRMPHGVAVDAAGNVYVTDTHSNRVLKLAAGSNTQTVLPFTGLDLCSNNVDAAIAGVAVDAAGAVYVSDSCHDRVVKLAAGSSTQTVLPFKGLDSPQGLAVDGAGTVYVVDYSHSQVVRLAAGSSSQTVLPPSGIGANPNGNVAVDASGNVYVGFNKSHYKGRAERYLLRLAPGSSTWAALPSAPDNFRANFSTGEQDLAVDAAGNVYAITSTDTQGVMKLAPGSKTWTPLPGAPRFVDPLGLAVDTQGNVYVADHVGSRATGSNFPWQQDDAQGFVLKLPAS